MASIFTYDPDPPRVSSPWSMSGTSTPQVLGPSGRGMATKSRSNSSLRLALADPDFLSDYGISKLEPEPQEGPMEYKLHLLLRPRRLYSSTSTGPAAGRSYHSNESCSTSGPISASYESGAKPAPIPSTQSRQQRLQQLTTQLLWRLQQSSPFHSSTAASLVLPVLPEASPQLGVPQKPTRLLPGLEESQGALYEIGVSDDGTFVGLVNDELEESLLNLHVMATSLGCKVEVLRRVIVGKCEWVEDSCAEGTEPGKYQTGDLWVAEALVSPDWDHYHPDSLTNSYCETRPSLSNLGEKDLPDAQKSVTEQIRISITGPTTAGKSSLLGTLTSSVLDNGRGASRLGLLKHRHEISSGITSSVAHELIGYAASEQSSDTTNVINYASGNVDAWNDVHATAKGGRLAFVSDLPGSVRYLKSTLRGLVSWAPHYILLCIPANCDDESNGSAEQTDITLALSYLDVCTKLDIPILVVITKMDLASRAGLRSNLTKVLSALKASGKKPAMLPGSPNQDIDLQHIASSDMDSVNKVISETDDWMTTVPIVLTSAIDGSGIGKLHAFIRSLPIPQRPPLDRTVLPESLDSPNPPSNIFNIDEVFAIPPSKVYSMSADHGQEENNGVVLCGLVRYGSIAIGDELMIGPLSTQTPETGAGQATQRRRSEQRSDQDDIRGVSGSGESPASFAHSLLAGRSRFSAQSQWQRVRVVSARNLRLPVQRLVQDQVGTIGVEPFSSDQDDQPNPRLAKIRKGSILASSDASPMPVPRPLVSHKGFVATFCADQFLSSLSPPLLLGGNAIVYISNIRSTVKVTCMALAEDELVSLPPSPTEPEFFSFDGDLPGGPDRSVVNRMVGAADGSDTPGDVRITFTFVNSVEWVEIGARVLLMPGASAALASSAQKSGAPTGLEGFSGHVCGVIPTEDGRSYGGVA
ncbi:hypothetical protein BDW42DRAFT_168221 [Aspergillus taichungensis]|uniref:Tr-type G domain-containing protein n=1 Tax=Aspergillus taichungensis TaxID=482145 RepID=A0A2J5HWG2_9EURO|nr:hypothetical protein BDW42DRAFT_168221 [Aspergillus taichungensis]